MAAAALARRSAHSRIASRPTRQIPLATDVDRARRIDDDLFRRRDIELVGCCAAVRSVRQHAAIDDLHRIEAMRPVNRDCRAVDENVLVVV